MINSVISDSSKGAKFLSADLKDFFLGSLMKNAEYMKIQFDLFPTDIVEKYKLTEKVADDGFIYMKIKKGCTD